MKYSLKSRRSEQEGFTLIEVLIAVAIVGIMSVGAGGIISQTFAENSRASGNMAATGQVENVGYWINHDALMTQTVTLGAGSGFPLILGWQDTAGNVNQATYAVSGNNLQRSLTVNGVLSSQSTVAANINSNAPKTNCTYAAGVLTFKITSAVGTSSQTRNYQVKLRIDQPSSYLTITTTSLPSGYSGTSYNSTLSAVGGTTPYVWTKISGDLPTGLSLSSAGLISGIPNVGSSVITQVFTVQVVDSAGKTATQEFSITLNILTILTTSLPDGKNAKDYGNNIPQNPVYVSAFGGTVPYKWSYSGNLPSGLSLASLTGLISGTPNCQTPGGQTYSFTVIVTDADSNIATKDLSIFIHD